MEWKLIYVGSAEDETYDQLLESVLVGPVNVGNYRFVLQASIYPCYLLGFGVSIGHRINILIPVLVSGRFGVLIAHRINFLIPLMVAGRPTRPVKDP